MLNQRSFLFSKENCYIAFIQITQSTFFLILFRKNVTPQSGPITEKRDLHIEETRPIVE